CGECAQRLTISVRFDHKIAAQSTDKYEWMVGATGIEPVTATMSRASSAPFRATPRQPNDAHWHHFPLFYRHIPPYCSISSHTTRTKAGAFGVPSGEDARHDPEADRNRCGPCVGARHRPDHGLG